MGNGCLMAALLLFATSACNDKHSSFSNFKDINESGWCYGDTLQFSPQELDGVKMRKVLLAIRHTNDYPYRNLWIEVNTRTGNIFRRDTLNIELADVYGRWHGKGFGPSYQYEVEVGNPIPVGDTTQVSVSQIMRVDTLRGIEQVGITFITPDK